MVCIHCTVWQLCGWAHTVQLFLWRKWQVSPSTVINPVWRVYVYVRSNRPTAPCTKTEQPTIFTNQHCSLVFNYLGCYSSMLDLLLDIESPVLSIQSFSLLLWLTSGQSLPCGAEAMLRTFCFWVYSGQGLHVLWFVLLHVTVRDCVRPEVHPCTYDSAPGYTAHQTQITYRFRWCISYWIKLIVISQHYTALITN